MDSHFRDNKFKRTTMTSVPTVTMDELSRAVQDTTISLNAKRVLEGILNDFMDLQFGKETPYTTGKTVIPSGSTIEDVNISATDSSIDKKFRDIFVKISNTHNSGDLTPQSPNKGWDPKLTPVLVFVTANN
ncbi:uncharacterized protein LOC113521899 [Galleria mellonella]|uniref:Uncharacterized protein LOC113521899 n=1 Tax=Galleria mellonella TaxID=7137 RepID=A0ABM3MWT0_GALME|nr:uncharacterized protein LOC113521899 [Galleria mellonella]